MLRVIYIVFLISFFGKAVGQDISFTNQQLSLPDSLEHDEHIRIYQSYGITNYTSMFEMYNEKGNWTATFYEYFAGDNPQSIQTDLKSKNDPDHVFQNFIRSYAMELPGMEAIRWKMNTRQPIRVVKDTFRGKPQMKYWSERRFSLFSDGNHYVLEIKYGDRINKINFGNPYDYKEIYSEVDELIYFCEILDIVKSEFGIWEEE